MVLALLFVGSAATGCSSSGTAAPSTTATASDSIFAGSASTWLSSNAEHWNRALNADQQTIDLASAAVSEATPTEFFGRLASACTSMRDDADKALAIPHAPLASLDSTWRTMLADTLAYASDCLALTRTGTNADFTRWKDSLSAMNGASAAFNTAVASVTGAGSTG